MHEFSLVKKEVERVLPKVNGEKVSRVVFFLGRLAHGTPRSIEEAFKIAARDSVLSKAKLEVVKIEPKVKCSSCGKVFSVNEEINLSCPGCQSKTNELVCGQECYIDSIEVKN